MNKIYQLQINNGIGKSMIFLNIYSFARFYFGEKSTQSEMLAFPID